MTLKNPFSDHGGIVTEGRFVGRQNEINLIRNRLLGETFGNIAIMGLPRIGKSSLAWNAILSIKEELVSKSIIPIWISFGEFSSLNEVFEEVFLELSEIQFCSHESQEIFKKFHKLFHTAKTSLEKRRFIKKYLRLLNSKKIRLILVIDEFDNASKILNLHDFQFLREISNNPETKIGLVIISRKTIQELEPDNGTLSNFYQIFTDLRLKLFSEDDFSFYWKRLKNFGIKLSQEYIDKTRFYCGLHPFLLDVLNYEVFNQIKQIDTNLDSTFKKIVDELKLKMFNEYESIIKLMINEGIERMMMQVIVGPVYDINQRDVEKLLKYDIIYPLNDGTFSSFANYFNDYLVLKANEIDIWPLWSEVENELRLLVKKYLNEKYGDDWENKYITQNKQKGAESFIQEKREMRTKNKRSFGNKASNDLVDYTYPMELFDRFIALDWGWSLSVFGKQKNDWKPIFEHLGRIRNPLAHNNPSFLTDSDKSIAEGYCKNILEKINRWKIK